MADVTFDSVPVRVVRDEEQGMYVIGVVVEDAFLTISAVKLGHGDELRRRAADARADAEQQEAQQQAERDAARKQQMEAEAQSTPAPGQQQQPPPPPPPAAY